MNENQNRPLKAFLGCGGISIFFLIVLLLAVTLACTATVAVPIYNKQILQEIACPPGTTLITSWDETTYTRPGEKVLNAYCEDAQGKQIQTQDLGYGALEYFPRYFVYSLAASFVLTLVVVIPLILLYQVIKRKFFSNPSPGSL
jgi:hypothetical protein